MVKVQSGQLLDDMRFHKRMSVVFDNSLFDRVIELPLQGGVELMIRALILIAIANESLGFGKVIIGNNTPIPPSSISIKATRDGRVSHADGSIAYVRYRSHDLVPIREILQRPVLVTHLSSHYRSVHVSHDRSNFIRDAYEW